ncbi:DUF4173 domain-containing protein, partial [Rhizobium leguminosarum]
AGTIRAPSMAALLLGFSFLASAPLLEAPSLTGIDLCFSALIAVALVGARLMPRSLTGLPLVCLCFTLVIPLLLADDIRKYLKTPAKRFSFTVVWQGVG